MARHARKIDYKAWDGIPGLTQAVSADSTFLASGALTFGIPATLLRTRTFIEVWFDATGLATDDEVSLTFGLALLSADAFSAGAGSVPDPSGEAEFPWIFWTAFHMRVIETFATGGTAASMYRQIDVDSKAMRKIKPGQALFWVGQYTDLGGAPVMQISIPQTRCLLGT